VRLCRPIAVFLLSYACTRTLGQVPPIQTTRQQHIERLQSLQQLVNDCISEASNCSAGRVGPDETLQLDQGVATQVNYTWLRKQLDALAKQKTPERVEHGQIILNRLGSSSETPAPQRDARKEANDVLRQVEFADANPSWWDRLTTRVGLWWARHFSLAAPSQSTINSARLVLEIFLFGIPLVLLVLWLLRQIKEDRLIPDFPPEASDKPGPSVSWVNEARACAERGEWRDAVHALYWQTITAFEERRIWAVTRTRTPREYLTLLQPGSERRKLLREQTILLEMIWYGHREATEEDYRRAAHLTEELAQA
jgi:hypothetical protein